ncbi:MAG: hypothetical protein JWR35_3693 [Marmoricola sp.]|nr:hypothetical protein [Marmoricola sp.]
MYLPAMKLEDVGQVMSPTYPPLFSGGCGGCGGGGSWFLGWLVGWFNQPPPISCGLRVPKKTKGNAMAWRSGAGWMMGR